MDQAWLVTIPTLIVTAGGLIFAIWSSHQKCLVTELTRIRLERDEARQERDQFRASLRLVTDQRDQLLHRMLNTPAVVAVSPSSTISSDAAE
jgi:hypothetical protein